ncbi:MAG: DnaJ family domain-containing protein [Dissulfurispiraceae bacterium]
MDAFTKIAEQRIKDAIDNGEFDNLSGSGKPLSLEDESWIPEDLRLAYRILKNNGFLPPELELRNEIINLRRFIDTIDDDKERVKKLRELNFKITKLGLMRGKPCLLEQFPEYESRFYEKALK